MIGTAQAGSWRLSVQPVELVIEHERVVAALCPQALNVRQLALVYAMLPATACLQGDLAQRWEVRQVLAAADWAEGQRKRKPMLKPKCERVGLI